MGDWVKVLPPYCLLTYPEGGGRRRHRACEDERQAKQPELQAPHDVPRHGRGQRRGKEAIAPRQDHVEALDIFIQLAVHVNR